MSRIITPHIWCPLCEREMKEQMVMYGQMRAKAYICQPCKIYTFSFDPAFNKWRDSDKKIPCPHCQHDEVKWFSRHVDNYIKFICPKCKVIGEGDCNSVMTADGTVDMELMEGSEQTPEETRVDVPIDHLKIPKNMKDKLKKKMRDNKERGK